MVLTDRTLGGRHGHCPKASRGHSGSTFSAHTPGNYIFLQAAVATDANCPPPRRVPHKVSGRTQGHIHWHLPSKFPELPPNISVPFKQPFRLLTSINFSEPSLYLFVSSNCLYPKSLLHPFLTSLSLFIDQGLVKKSLFAFCMPSWTF